MNGTTVIVQPAHTPDFSVWILIPIIISIGTMAVSLYYSYRQRKREQFKIALDVSNRLQDIRKSYEEAVQNVPQVFSGNSIEKISDPTAIEALTKKYAFEILYLLNMFSILVNNKEINNFSIQLGMFRQYTDTTQITRRLINLSKIK